MGFFRLYRRLRVLRLGSATVVCAETQDSSALACALGTSATLHVDSAGTGANLGMLSDEPEAGCALLFSANPWPANAQLMASIRTIAV